VQRVPKAATVLAVDDDPTVLLTLGLMLQHGGFRVITACEVEEALDLYRAHADEIVAAVVDEGMPVRSGSELLAEIRRLDPQARVVLSSGDWDGAPVQTGAEGPSAYLPKPFTLDGLLSAVRGVLVN